MGTISNFVVAVTPKPITELAQGIRQWQNACHFAEDKVIARDQLHSRHSSFLAPEDSQNPLASAQENKLHALREQIHRLGEFLNPSSSAVADWAMSDDESEDFTSVEGRRLPPPPVHTPMRSSLGGHTPDLSCSPARRRGAVDEKPSFTINELRGLISLYNSCCNEEERLIAPSSMESVDDEQKEDGSINFHGLKTIYSRLTDANGSARAFSSSQTIPSAKVEQATLLKLMANRLVEEEFNAEKNLCIKEAQAKIAKVALTMMAAGAFAYILSRGDLGVAQKYIEKIPYIQGGVSAFKSDLLTRVVVLGAISSPATMLAAGGLLTSQAIIQTVTGVYGAYAAAGLTTAMLASVRIVSGALPLYIAGSILVQKYNLLNFALIEGNFNFGHDVSIDLEKMRESERKNLFTKAYSQEVKTACDRALQVHNAQLALIQKFDEKLINLRKVVISTVGGAIGSILAHRDYAVRADAVNLETELQKVRELIANLRTHCRHLLGANVLEVEVEAKELQQSLKLVEGVFQSFEKQLHEITAQRKQRIEENGEQTRSVFAGLEGILADLVKDLAPSDESLEDLTKAATDVLARIQGQARESAEDLSRELDGAVQEQSLRMEKLNRELQKLTGEAEYLELLKAEKDKAIEELQGLVPFEDAQALVGSFIQKLTEAKNKAESFELFTEAFQVVFPQLEGIIQDRDQAIENAENEQQALEIKTQYVRAISEFIQELANQGNVDALVLDLANQDVFFGKYFDAFSSLRQEVRNITLDAYSVNIVNGEAQLVHASGEVKLIRGEFEGIRDIKNFLNRIEREDELAYVLDESNKEAFEKVQELASKLYGEALVLVYHEGSWQFVQEVPEGAKTVFFVEDLEGSLQALENAKTAITEANSQVIPYSEDSFETIDQALQFLRTLGLGLKYEQGEEEGAVVICPVAESNIKLETQEETEQRTAIEAANVAFTGDLAALKVDQEEAYAAELKAPYEALVARWQEVFGEESFPVWSADENSVVANDRAPEFAQADEGSETDDRE